MKILNIILSILFVLFAVVQYNDPDPVGWIIFYALVAVVCGFAVFGRYHQGVNIVGAIICLAVCVYYFPGLTELFGEHEIGDLTRSMKADKPYIEESRESLGALIAFFAMLFHYFRAKKVLL